MKIPQDNKQIIVSNGINSIQGLISYTKNIDLDEKGYFKLSAPMCNIFSSNVADGGDVDLDLPVDMFAWSDSQYKVVTDGRAFNFVLNAMTFTEDTGITTYHDKTRIINWVNGNWFVGAEDVYEYNGVSGTANYTSRITTLLDYIELFTNKNSLVGSNTDNTLKMYNTSYANTITLTIPANFTITGTAYSNNQMGIITRGSKNQGNAYFFTWDGSTTSATFGFPVNDSYLTGLGSYKSSWALFSSSGQLLFFNGGGFEELGNLPIFRFEDDLLTLGPNNSVVIGNLMDVDGDKIYVNCASTPQYSSTFKPYRYGYSGGVYCYDPEVGFYHKYAPSYSKYTSEDCEVASNIITSASAHYLEDGDEVWLRATDLGIAGERIYYAIKLSATTFKLADTYADALANTSITITNGTLDALFWVKRKDFGVESLGFRDLGFVKKLKVYSGFELSGVYPNFMGSAIHPNDVTATRENVVNATVPLMSNRGYLITSKFQTDNFENNWQGVGIKYSKLSPQSSIVVKAKVKDQEPIIVSDMTLFDTYTGPYIIWDADGISFDTTFDISDAEIGDEVHVFVGAGAGQSAHIASIELVGSNYHVILDEKLRGIISNAKSCITIDKWVKLGTITADDIDGYKFLPLNEPSGTLEIKCELRGIGVKISEILPISKPHKPNVA